MSRESTAHGPDEDGFTLIEILVTVTLLSFLFLLLFGGLRFGQRAWERVQAHGEGTDDLRVVQDVLRREIEQAYPFYNVSDPLHPVIDFQGDESGMTFLAPPPQSKRQSGRSRVTIAGERVRGDLQLTIRAVPELAVTRSGAWSAPLLHNLAGVRFSFFGADHWSSSWTNAAAMPSLVRVHVSFRPGDGRVWPDLIVAPRIETDTGCVYDPVTQRCRGRA